VERLRGIATSPNWHLSMVRNLSISSFLYVNLRLTLPFSPHYWRFLCRWFRNRMCQYVEIWFNHTPAAYTTSNDCVYVSICILVSHFWQYLFIPLPFKKIPFDIAMSYRRRNPIWTIQIDVAAWFQCCYRMKKPLQIHPFSPHSSFWLPLPYYFWKMDLLPVFHRAFSVFLNFSIVPPLQFVHIIAFEPMIFSARKNSAWLFAFANSFSFAFRQLTTFRFY